MLRAGWRILVGRRIRSLVGEKAAGCGAEPGCRVSQSEKKKALCDTLIWQSVACEATKFPSGWVGSIKDSRQVGK